MPAIAKILGDRGRKPGAVQAHQRRIVGGGRNHHRAPPSFRPENTLDEFLHLTAAFADQSDHDDVGGGIPRHHP